MSNSLKIAACLLASSLAVQADCGTLCRAAERPTLINTCDPRPDIFPRPFYDNHTEYRLQYNRPRYVTGWLAHTFSPTSQEAMVWCENNRAGNYQEMHMPPMYKRYFAPKPWEVLETGARPDFSKPDKTSSTSRGEMPKSRARIEIVPSPIEEPSASDN